MHQIYPCTVEQNTPCVLHHLTVRGQICPATAEHQTAHLGCQIYPAPTLMHRVTHRHVSPPGCTWLWFFLCIYFFTVFGWKHTATDKMVEQTLWLFIWDRDKSLSLATRRKAAVIQSRDNTNKHASTENKMRAHHDTWCAVAVILSIILNWSSENIQQRKITILIPEAVCFRCSSAACCCVNSPLEGDV